MIKISIIKKNTTNLLTLFIKSNNFESWSKLIIKKIVNLYCFET